jgi:hypothetical protein
MPPNGDESFLDSITSIDNRIADVREEVTEIRRVAQDSVDVASPIGNKGSAPIERGVPRRKRSIDLTANVPSRGTQTEKEGMPFDGFVNGIIAGWPDGADLKVGVKVINNRDGNVYFPTGDDDFAAYNNFTNMFPVSFPIQKDEEIAAKFKSNKSINDVPVNVTLQAYRKLPSESMEEIRRRLS